MINVYGVKRKGTRRLDGLNKYKGETLLKFNTFFSSRRGVYKSEPLSVGAI
jgi:hypothetical protein